MKDNDEKEMKIEFAPGCFDQFDGTQEELEAFQKEIMDMISNMTPEELAAQSTPLDEDMLEDLFEEDPEAATALMKALFNEPRKLQ